MPQKPPFPNPVIDTRGSLESVRLADGVLCVSGWCAGFPPDKLDACRLYVGNHELEGSEVLGGGESPDVEKQYPSLQEGRSARFLVRKKLDPKEHGLLLRSLVAIVPLSARRPGHVLLGLLEGISKLPSTEALNLVGGGMGCGFESLSHLIQRAGLLPDESVLDVGCGVGRMALPLSYYLSERGNYLGFDVVPSGIRWAKEHIARDHSNFRFEHVDVRNGMYNPEGRLEGATFPFPCADASVDLAFLTSVFTHMLGREVRHYLDELRRVLRPGGRCLCTFYLRNAEVDAMIATGKSSIRPVHAVEDGFTINPAMPEDVVAFEESAVLRWIEECGFTLESIVGGAWSGRERFATDQDLLVIRKPT